jgi:predicted membrane protein
MENNRARHLSPQLLFGLLVIFLGVVFTLNNVGVIESDEYIRYWPAFLVLYGVVNMIERQSSSGRLWAGLWIVIGTVWLLNNLDITHVHLWDYWPLILVVIGIGMMRGSFPRGRRFQRFTGAIASESTGTDQDSFINGVAILGGFKRSNNSQDFLGGELTAIMGGAELDLRDASIQKGEAVLDIFAFMGGAKIRVPDDWTIVLRGVPILGGFEDKTRPPKVDTGKRLVIKGMAIMGGAEIDN